MPSASTNRSNSYCERCLHEPGQQRSGGALASLDAPSQESQLATGSPRLEGLNVSLINPDCHHPQLLSCVNQNQKALV